MWCRPDRSDIPAADQPSRYSDQEFVPIASLNSPEYELQKLSFPPVLHMIEYIQRERFTELIISTPGPVGLTHSWLERCSI